MDRIPRDLGNAIKRKSFKLNATFQPPHSYDKHIHKARILKQTYKMEPINTPIDLDSLFWRKNAERICQIKDRIFNKNLPDRLKEIAQPFQEVAEKICSLLPANRDTILALEALEAAKDAAVRAAL